MAALWGLTVLLLCAVNISLAQVTPSPASTSDNTSSLHFDSQTNTTQNRTSPPVTTEKNTTKDVTTALPPAQTQCFHTVTPIPFGLRINVNFTAGNYRINLTEEGRPETRWTFNLQSFNQSSSHNITHHLKPCTKYQYEVAFINNDGNETSCNPTEDKNGTVTTEQMREVDISTAVNKSTPGFIYFQSDWDISSSLSPPNKFQQCINETCSIKLDIKDICSDFTATFTSGNSSINVTKSITVDILNPSDIEQTVSPGLPATIKPTLPSKCNDLSVDYTCSENGKVKDSKKLSELEPFTDYTCTGLIKVNNVPSDKRTTPIPIRIDCRFALNIIKREKTNTSIELTWTTTSDNCQDALPRLHNLSLSYNCSCETSESKIAGKLIRLPDGGKCSFTELTPYTDYTCDIVPTYKQDKKDNHRQRVYQRTDAGTPANITHVNWTLPENNVIKVSCDYSGQWFGPDKIYRARLNNEKVPDSRKCEFEFKDLSYSTIYTVEVTVFNGVLESKPKIMNISTKYNYKALIGSLCFLIVTVFVVAFVVSYKIYKKRHRESRSSVNDDMMLESAIYMNTRPPGWRHKAAR